MIGLIPYVAPLLVAAVFCGAFIVVALPQRSVPGLRWFVAFMACLVVWTLGYAAELVAPDLSMMVLAAKVQYLGIGLVGGGWLGFVAEYTGLTWWSRRKVLLALVVPAATLVLVWTNEGHGLVWSSVEATTGRPYSALALGHGPWFWVQVGYSYLCLLVALGLLVRVILIRPPLFRGQATLLFLACLPPWIGNALYVTGWADTDLDLTVFGFTVSGFLAGWAILRWKLLSIGPIARDTIVEGMAEPVAVIDLEGRVVDVNPAALRVLGRDADQVIGWSSTDALGRFAPDLSGTGRTRTTVKGLAEERSYDCEVTVLDDAKGRHRGWALVLHDVTERAREAEAQRRAREAAEDLALAQRAFLSNMNHELRTPLNGVMGMLQVLLHTELTPEQRGYAKTALSSGEDLVTLVDRIMDFSAIEMGKLQLTQVAFDLASAVRRAVEGSQRTAAAKGLTLRLEMGPDVPARVVGDPARVGQVLASVVDNAVKFTDTGSVEVVVALAGREEGVARVRMEVKDTGIGIPPHRMEEIFRGFTQVDGSSTRRHEGAGLGLTIAQRVVRGMGGEIRVASEVGRGSTFSWEIPFTTPK